VRSTPARMLREGQLVVERHAVSKITKVDHAIPHNTVIAEVTNQVTGEESTRTLRWDEHVTTEEPLEVDIGDTGKITVELALQRDNEDRPLYRYRITDEAAGIDHEGMDLRLRARLPADNTKAAKTLLSFLMRCGVAAISTTTVIPTTAESVPSSVPRKSVTVRPAVSTHSAPKVGYGYGGEQ
jgi:hypothetical protein